MKKTVRTVAEAQAIINQIAPASYKNYSLIGTGKGDIDSYLKKAISEKDEVSIWYSDKESNADNKYCVYVNDEGKAGVKVLTWSKSKYNVVAEIEIDYSEENAVEVTTEAEVEVEEYAVSVEAQEVALQAEFEAAKENAEKLNPFSKFGGWYTSWKIQADIESGEKMNGDRGNLEAEKVDLARYGSNVRAEAVYEKNALVISNPAVENSDKKALVVFYFNPQGKPAAYVKTLKTDTYIQYGRGGRKSRYEVNERLVFNKYVQADRLEYALAIFKLTVNQLVELYSKLAVGERATLTYNKISKSYKIIEAEEEKTSPEITISVPKNIAKDLAEKLKENIKTLSVIHTATDDTYQVFDVNTKATVYFDNSSEETASTFEEAYKKATAFFIVEDDGSNDDPEEEEIITVEVAVEDEDDDDELIDEAEVVQEKIYYAKTYIGYESMRYSEKEFKTAVDAYNYLLKKRCRYSGTTYWLHEIVAYDGKKEETIYEDGDTLRDGETTTDPEIQILIDESYHIDRKKIAIEREVENKRSEEALKAWRERNAEYQRKLAEAPIIYYVENGTSEADIAEYAVTPEALEVATQAEIDNAVVEANDAEKDFLVALEATLEETVQAENDTVAEVIEYKPKLTDKPYSCVTVRRFSEFTTSSFNPEKFFYSLNDAVKYAILDKHKRMDWDERYGGAVVYLDYENGMHRPIWEITAEGNFETIDATEDYGELADDSVKAELANLDEDTLAALDAEIEIKATLDKLAKLKEIYPQIYSKLTTDNVLTFKAKTSRKAKKIAS